MKRTVKIVFIICSFAIIGVITVQLFWLRNYVAINRDRFTKEIATSFEKAAKKEFQQRGDSIVALLKAYMLDTSQVLIKSSWNSTSERYIYTIINRQDEKDMFAISFNDINVPLSGQSDPVKKEIIAKYIQGYRTDEFDRDILINNRTQNIYFFIKTQISKHGFDAERLSRIFKKYLAENNIHEEYIFYFGDTESSLDELTDSVHQEYPYTTSVQPTHRNQKDYNYMVARFKPPVSYLTSKLTFQIASSVLLIIIVGFALYYLIRTIYREKKLSAIKNDFISNISHEFKTPIATASAAIEAMEKFDVLQDPSRTKKYLSASKNELNRLSDLVNKILDISLYEKKQIELKFETVHIGEMIDLLVANFSLIKKNETDFRVLTECEVPVIKADRIHLYNSLSNIIDNAIKYTGTAAIIHIRVTCSASEVVIEIRDNGIGIPSDSIPHIFEKFYRVPSSDGYKVKGFGLGLYYTKSIINEHHGWCKVESEKGKGTTFKIGLPK